ncbi:hypothetical protein DM02DRAFT_673790 [Periconia macrospinosa]|uniref:Uncharacterized protein n=1 Tax=Periconia macrospinosa TaxID=97972 RepID=A0A2V1DKV8_9PLEO|nr:hypothetical protein DM02DRAFT_673790 [Periconia macrospinosa]
MIPAFQKCMLISPFLVSLAFANKIHEAASTPSATHPPVPTASWPTLPSNFSDLPSQSVGCWNSHFFFSFTTYFLWTEASKSITPVVTTYIPPVTHKRTYTYDTLTDCSTTNFGLTTLCDGVPRATSRSSQCRTTQFVTSDVWVQSSSTLSYIRPTWTSEFQPPQPTCKVAADGSSLCTRMYDAWSYRASQLDFETTLAPSYRGTLYNMMGPRCTRSDPSSTTYTGTMCRMIAPTYSVYYWPTPTPSGSEFCQSSRPTPTITDKPSTKVIAGHTLTSPSVYHFLRDVRIESYLFDKQRYNLSTAVPSDQVLTVAQLETDILSASVTCSGREGDYCTASLTPDFRIDDIFTARKDAYQWNCRCGTATIYQTNYKPSLAVPIREVVKQNHDIGGQDCDWDLWGGYSGDRYSGGVESSTPVLMFENVPKTAFVPITTEVSMGVETGAPPRGRRVEGVAAPTVVM